MGQLTGTLSVNLAQSRVTVGEKPLCMSKGSFRVGLTGGPKFEWHWVGLIDSPKSEWHCGMGW